MILILALIVAFCGLIIGSYTDIKTREVPDWLNFSLIATGIGIHLIYSITQQSYGPILQSLTGFGIGLAIALAMYYGGQWGGGDSKLLMGIGALFGQPMRLDSLLTSFLTNLLLVGAIYGLFWLIGLAILNIKKIRKSYTKNLNQHKTMRYTILAAAIAGFILMIFASDLRLLISVILGLAILMFHLWICIKSVEESCMLKWMEPEKLTEGDWIAKPIRIGKKEVYKVNELGVTKSQISFLKKLSKQGKVKKVLVKEGIPFVPSFLLTLIFTLIFGNIIILIVQNIQ